MTHMTQMTPVTNENIETLKFLVPSLRLSVYVLNLRSTVFYFYYHSNMRPNAIAHAVILPCVGFSKTDSNDVLVTYLVSPNIAAS